MLNRYITTGWLLTGSTPWKGGDLFSRKSTLNYRSVRVHFIIDFHTLKQSNTLESVHRNLIRRAEICVRQNGQHFQQFL